MAHSSPLPEISSAPGATEVVVTLTGAHGTGVPELAAGLRARLGTSVTIVVAAQAGHHAREAASEVVYPPGPTATPAPITEASAASRPAVAALTLLTGLDLDCPPLARAEQEAADATLRAALAHAGTDYRVVYGKGEQRVAHALIAIQSIAKEADFARTTGLFDAKMSPEPPMAHRRRAAWSCEKCSDPECEHKLFTSLMGRSAGSDADA